nr:glycosyltransferase family 39 protein [Alphaproteobacteria bacterium]
MTKTILNSPYARPALLAATICIGLMLAALYARPLFPVDETRYVTVAWEMHQSGNWILPTLNGEAYHHKPPILFWLINILWSIVGVSQGAAMVVPYLGSFAFLMVTARLSTRLFPTKNKAPLIATALLAGGLPFVIYANLIMFDLLLGVCTVLGITAIWDYLTTRQIKHLAILSLAVGLGALTKGPVILLHVGTILLLTKFWLTTQEKPLKTVILPITASILMGAALALCWAIPAAIEGGKEFADKIFWGQTAGRMVKAFDHQRPFYWYFTFLPLFTLPWLASPLLWRGLKAQWQSRTINDRQINRFLLAWGAPVLIAFCLISGKQVHYLIPLLPCLALYFTCAILKSPETTRKRDIWPVLIAAIFLSLIPVIMKVFANQIGAIVEGDIHLEDAFGKTSLLPPILIALTIIALTATIKGNKIRALVVVSISMMLMMSGFQLAAKDGFFENYNLTPIAEELQKIDAQTPD